MNNGGTPSKGVGGGRGGDTAAKGAVLPYCSGRKCPGLSSAVPQLGPDPRSRSLFKVIFVQSSLPTGEARESWLF